MVNVSVKVILKPQLIKFLQVVVADILVQLFASRGACRAFNIESTNSLQHIPNSVKEKFVCIYVNECKLLFFYFLNSYFDISSGAVLDYSQCQSAADASSTSTSHMPSPTVAPINGQCKRPIFRDRTE